MESPTGFGTTPAGPLDVAAGTANQATRAAHNSRTATFQRHTTSTT